MDKKIHWHLMSWQEIREAQKRNPVILIPAGTIETQGPYTYVGLECVVPQRLAEEVARRTNALVVPTIPFGHSALFQDFPGTITLRPVARTTLPARGGAFRGGMKSWGGYFAVSMILSHRASWAGAGTSKSRSACSALRIT